ncbi:MAG: hypothetical protein WB555_20565 [Candidatus Korobacteraceae bacterium]
MSKEIKARVTPHFSLILDGEDGTPAKTWKLCPTYKAIAKIEDAIGLDIKRIESWKELSSGKHFPKIVHGLLEKHNPEVTLDEVLEVLNPEAQTLLSDEIFYLMFPGVREAMDKQKATGETAAPNVQKATTTG